MRTLRLAVAITATALMGLRLGAQQTDSGVVRVVVQEAMGMLGGFRVQAAGRTAITDATGVARLRLPVGKHAIDVARIGFSPAHANVLILRDTVVSVEIPMSMSAEAMEMESVKVSATRTERPAGETAVRVEIVDAMEVDEKTLMSPSGIGMLLNETPGLRVQAAAPGLGTGSVRILGLPGQYTVMLADGLPLYGGSASALGPLDVSPVDLQRVEIIKGAASALYGGQSLGGVINLVSKPPSGKKELLLNRRMLGVTDAATWLSQRFGSNVGLSLLAAGTVQSAEDIDRDGWADQARARRWNVRPRFNIVDPEGRSLFVTAGYGYDDRSGGTLGTARAPDGTVFREALRSDRADIGATAAVPLRGDDKLAMRFSVSGNRRTRLFGPGPEERDHASTGFIEITRSFVGERATTVIGTALQVEDFGNQLNNRFDHRWWTPALFATSERIVGPLTLSASLRGDAHPEAGTLGTGRLAVLAKPVAGWTVRGSFGTGFAAPTPTTEETEAVGLRSVSVQSRLHAEKSRAGMLDVNGRIANAEVLITAYGSVIDDAIQLADVPGASGTTTLQNAAQSSRIGGVEALAAWRFGSGKFIATYGYSRGSRPDATSGVREPMPMIPRHRVGADLMLERPGDYRLGVEGTWYGVQPLDDNPFRSASKPYLYVMAIVAKQVGSLEFVANFENLLDVRQTDTDPLVRSTPGMGGRWTTDVWAPLEGFMANVAVRYRWQ
ncbi:MAG TPA: TonB-dependent receptor [Gemmatimonadaceae bacterium]|nr:TonB-dependent receptor [Gemmatimonadaceae bacterium]